jgi:glycogen debranching enzyme
MDAKIGDWVVTPRQGKAVEINALWYNALVILADFRALAGDAAGSKGLTARAKAVRTRFEEAFWNAETGCLYDVVDGDRRDASIRPNQIFALALPHTLLPKDKARKVLEVVEQRLLTPFGLRSLDPADPAYRARYEGGPAERDSAYHQGTVWSWLLGPYADALVKTLGAPGKARARKAIEGILGHLADAGIGTISEIFDAEAPHAPRGCPAQAWSVSEVFRVWRSLTAEAPARARSKDAPAKKSYRIVKAKEAGASRRRARPPEAE